MKKGGYWLKGKDVYYTLIVDIGFHSHIRYLIRNHSAFQISKKNIEKTYAKHKERMGFEGRAREELIKAALAKGWIRVRHQLSPYDHWIIQCDDISQRKPVISAFLNWRFKNQKNGDYEPVEMEDMKGTKIKYEYCKDTQKDFAKPFDKLKITVLRFMDDVNI